ncbi:MAG: hypothetical protein KAU46_00410 [Candidatus Aminicenantes bacterium]|nr:hypothetical protein [Candidatus Aminicenantes bacterium]
MKGKWEQRCSLSQSRRKGNSSLVGIAYYSVVDLYDHAKGIERYMGLPQDNRAGYEYASNIRLA